MKTEMLPTRRGSDPLCSSQLLLIGIVQTCACDQPTPGAELLSSHYCCLVVIHRRASSAAMYSSSQTSCRCESIAQSAGWQAAGLEDQYHSCVASHVR